MYNKFQVDKANKKDEQQDYLRKIGLSLSPKHEDNSKQSPKRELTEVEKVTD